MFIPVMRCAVTFVTWLVTIIQMCVLPIHSSELHLPGSATATPSSSALGTVNPAPNPVLSAPTWRVLFPASNWRSGTKTFCSTSCPLMPAVWLVSLTCCPTTLRSWASSTSLFPRPPWIRWGWRWWMKVIHLCIKGFWPLSAAHLINWCYYQEFSSILLSGFKWKTSCKHLTK